MKGRERVLATLDFEEPDRVPITELGVDPRHVRAIAGANDPLKCYRKLNFDLIVCGVAHPEDWRPKVLPDGSIVDEWGRICKIDPITETSIPVGTTIKSIEDWKEHPLPDPEASGRMNAITNIVNRIKDGEMLVAGSVRSPFALAWEIFMPSRFCQLLFEKPAEIARVIEEITEFNIKVIKQLIEAGAELIIQSGDLAEKRGPLVSPKYFDEIIFPNLRREVEAAHKMGVKFIKHTDGFVVPLLKGLIEIANVDGIHSLDPSAGVDIGMVKQEYGDRLVLMGNVSVDNLATKDREEIIKETMECLRVASPGGGYILTSSNSWYTDCKLENCLALVETGRRYGRYPLRI
ncbi:hypothetical protein DRO37_06525 [Candidatus Bathyarchaeota archaeon]|nr:MAG: hypothetical protein DRO37_06525 [Candidatus Bathyarchaeota archaeon]